MQKIRPLKGLKTHFLASKLNLNTVPTCEVFKLQEDFVTDLQHPITDILPVLLYTLISSRAARFMAKFIITTCFLFNTITN